MRFATITIALFAAAATARVASRDEASPDAPALTTEEFDLPSLNGTEAADEFAGEPLSDDLSEEDLEGLLHARGGVPKVVFGMQTQNHDGTTYWTVWKHGDNPCKKNVVLNPKHESACQKKFGLSNVKDIKLASCLGAEKLPHSLIHDGKNIRRCKHKRTKHSCPGGIRDVVERGSC